MPKLMQAYRPNQTNQEVIDQVIADRHFLLKCRFAAVCALDLFLILLHAQAFMLTLTKLVP